MSDILDALRKAELAREHARAPGLSTQQRYTVAPDNRSLWRWGVGAFVLGLGCAGLLTVYTGRGDLAVAPAAASSRAPEAPPATPAPPTPVAKDAAVPRTGLRPPGPRRAPPVSPAAPAAPAVAPAPALPHPAADPGHYTTPVSLQRSIPVESPADDTPAVAAVVPRSEEPPVATAPQQVTMLHESLRTSPPPQAAPTPHEQTTVPVVAVPEEEEAVPAAVATEDVADPVPLLRTLPYRFQSIVPKLVINAQAYAEAVEDRFVIINMKKYAEGQQTDEGVIIEAIRKDDTVLVYQGQPFRLQR